MKLLLVVARKFGICRGPLVWLLFCIIAKQCALVQCTSSTVEFLMVFTANWSCLRHFINPCTARFKQWESFDKDLLSRLLHWLVYRLVNNALFKVSPDFHQLLLLGHVTYTGFLYAPCTQLKVLYSTVLRCELTRGHKSSEMKSGVSWRRNSTVERALWTSTTPAHWPTGNLCQHNLQKTLF